MNKDKPISPRLRTVLVPVSLPGAAVTQMHTLTLRDILRRACEAPTPKTHEIGALTLALDIIAAAWAVNVLLDDDGNVA